MTPLQDLYFKMYRIRKIEEAIAAEYPKQQMRCPVHLSIGQEAAAVGVASVLTKDDMMVSTHRGHAHYLAKGGSLRGLLCELHGKAAGCGRGQGGSMHLVDISVGFRGSTSIVGGTIPVGVGLAFAKKIKKEKGIVVVCIGDAAIEEGVFHESANFAGLHELPVLFLCENNRFSCYTHIDDRQPVRGSIRRLANGHGLDYYGTDGNDVRLVAETAENILKDWTGPTFLELQTWRHHRHCGPGPDDHLNYRPQSAIDYFETHEPLKITESQLFAAGEWTTEFVDSLAVVHEEIRQEMDYAIKAPFPDQSELGNFLYANNHSS